LDKNRINSADNQQREGWIQTLLPQGPTLIGVLMSGNTVSADALAITIENDKIPQKMGQTSLWKQIQYNDNTLLLYQSPVGGANLYTGILMSATTPNASILGVYGLTGAEAMEAEALCGQLRLNYQAHDLKQADNGSANINIQVKE
jgi:hypothetical protein